jgi:iron complex outermembrane recepter protein
MKHLLSTVAMSCVAFAAASAYAADAAPVDAPVAAAAADDQDAGSLLDSVVVTATKRETDLQSTPISISVIDAKVIADRHVQSLLDLADGAIPGLRIATFEARQSALTIGIRGIVPLDANQPARDQGVGVYLDGVYLGRQHGLNAALLDVERIEVLKGPQGTLFGRNTEGGALSIVTKAPTGEFGLRATSGVGNYGAYNGDLHLDLPAVADVAVKIDGVVQHQDATTKNSMPGETGWNYFDRQGLRVSAQWRPTDTFKALYAFDVGRDSNSPFYSQLLNYNPLGLPVGPASGTLPSGAIRPLPSIVRVEGKERMKVSDIGVPQQPSVDKTRGHSLHMNWSPMANFELRSITAWREISVTQWDNSGGAHRVPVYAPNGNFSRYSLATLDQNQFSQEIQAVGNTERVDYVGGLFFFREKTQDDAATPNTNRWNADGTGWTILDPTPTFPGFRSLDRASVAWSKSYAVYGQARYTPPVLADSLHLTLGGRLTRDDKHGSLFIVNNARTNLTFEEKNDRFDPLVVVDYDVSPDVNLYARYSTGYRAGGASSRSLTYRSFGPETVDAYEIGAKMEFMRRFRLNVAGYMMDREGSQIDFSLVTPVGASTRNTLETINAPGKTKIRGVELEGRAQLTPEFSVSASYAYTYTKVPPTVNPFNGLVQPVFIVFTPRNAASASIDYAKPVSFGTVRAHLDANYADATQTFDQTPVKNDKSFIMNGRLSLGDIEVVGGEGTVTLSLWARNLLNEAYVYRRDPANRAVLGDYGNFNAPRTYGLEATVRF